MIVVLNLESRKRALFSQRLICKLKVNYWFGFDFGCLVFTYLESYLFGASTQKSKRDSASVNSCTNFGKSKKSFISNHICFAQVNKSQSAIRHQLIFVLILKMWFGFDCSCLVFTYLEPYLFGASKQKSKRDSTSVNSCTDFGMLSWFWF